MHSALVHWLPPTAKSSNPVPPVLRLIALSRFPEDGPRWPDGGWSIVLFFEQPPSEYARRTSIPAKVAFAFEQAPHERLRVGARFALYFGRTQFAEVEVVE